jgi:transcriptional regulator with XRE-family HTH domain
MEKEKLDRIAGKIAGAHIKKGYTYENMAHELSITPAAYRKIEIGKTKLTVERLLQISEILKTPLPELPKIENDVFQQTNNETATGYQQKIENYYQENREITQILVESLKEEISYLKTTVAFLQEMLKKR